MKEVKRKLLGFALAFIFIAMLVAPVMAGKGQTKQSFQLVYQEHPLSTDGPDSHAGPVGSVLGVDLRTFHGRDCTHDSDILLSTLTIGGIAEEYTIHKQGGCNYDFNSKTMMVIHRVTETLTLSYEGTVYGTIVLSIVEKIDWTTMESEGTFTAFGTDYFEDVKIVGTESSQMVYWDDFDFNQMILEITYSGTVMGWPT